MKYIFYKAITHSHYLAFLEYDNGDTSVGVSIVEKQDEDIKLLTPPIFSHSFFQKVECHDTILYHLHGKESCPDELLYDQWEGQGYWQKGSYLFSVEFLQHVRFEKCFEDLSIREDEILEGVLDGHTYYGMVGVYQYPRLISFIPVKYNRIIRGKEYYIACLSSEGWDIYDNVHFDDNNVHYCNEESFGDKEILNTHWVGKFKRDYYCFLDQDKASTCVDEQPYLLYLHRVLARNLPSIREDLREPFPLTADNKTYLIGCPRDSVADNSFEGALESSVYSKFVFSPPCTHESFVFYVVTNNGKKGVWKNKRINKLMHMERPGYADVVYRGFGELVLPCLYQDIIPLIETVKSSLKKESEFSLTQCNSLAIRSDSGWGVYDGLNERTVVTPVLDEPPTALYGPNGYICKKENKFGLMNEKGDMLLPFVYDSIQITKEYLENLYNNCDGENYIDHIRLHYSVEARCGDTVKELSFQTDII